MSVWPDVWSVTLSASFYNLYLRGEKGRQLITCGAVACIYSRMYNLIIGTGNTDQDSKYQEAKLASYGEKYNGN